MIASLINIKGGVGKSTSAIALATAAKQAGRDVRVLDADPQSSATLWALEAAEAGDPLPFDVGPANVGTVRALAKTNSDELIIIDCPPSGSIVDEAMKASDFVIVPTSPKPADLTKTYETVSTLEEAGKLHAVLITSARAGTLTLKSALAGLEDNEVSHFTQVIPLREDLGAFFANSFGDELYGYKEVYAEMMEAME